jgi:hypothetical protein
MELAEGSCGKRLLLGACTISEFHPPGILARSSEDFVQLGESGVRFFVTKDAPSQMFRLLAVFHLLAKLPPSLSKLASEIVRETDGALTLKENG